MRHQAAGKTHVGAVHDEGTEDRHPLLDVEFVERFRALRRLSRPLALLQRHVEDGGIGVAGGHLANVGHLEKLRRVLPDFLSGLVVLAAEDDGSLVVDVAAFKRGGVGLAMIEASLDPPVLVWAPLWGSDDDLVPVSEKSVGKHQLAAAGLVDDFLLALPGSFGGIELAFAGLPLRMSFGIALGVSGIVKSGYLNAALRPSRGHPATNFDGGLRR